MNTETQIEEINVRVAKATAHTATLAAAATASARAAYNAYAVAHDAAIAVQTSLLLAQGIPVRVAAATAVADSAYTAAVAAATKAHTAFSAATEARAAFALADANILDTIVDSMDIKDEDTIALREKLNRFMSNEVE